MNVSFHSTISPRSTEIPQFVEVTIIIYFFILVMEVYIFAALIYFYINLQR